MLDVKTRVSIHMVNLALKNLVESNEKLPRIYDTVSRIAKESEDSHTLLMVMEDVFLTIDGAIDTLLREGVVPTKVLHALKAQFESEADRLYEQYEKTHDIHSDRMAYAFELAAQAVEKAIAEIERPSDT